MSAIVAGSEAWSGVRRALGRPYSRCSAAIDLLLWSSALPSSLDKRLVQSAAAEDAGCRRRPEPSPMARSGCGRAQAVWRSCNTAIEIDSQVPSGTPRSTPLPLLLLKIACNSRSVDCEIRSCWHSQIVRSWARLTQSVNSLVSLVTQCKSLVAGQRSISGRADVRLHPPPCSARRPAACLDALQSRVGRTRPRPPWRHRTSCSTPRACRCWRS